MRITPAAPDHTGEVLRRPHLQQASLDGLTLRQRCEADNAGLTALFSQEDFQRNGWTWDPIDTEVGQAQLHWQWASAFEVVAHRGGDTTSCTQMVRELCSRQQPPGSIALRSAGAPSPWP